MRFAYVAQHAFHHIEQHLDKTPNQYIQWRYATGEDRENLVKVGRVVTDAEQAAMEKLVLHDGVKKQVDKLLSRCASSSRVHLRACASSPPATGLARIWLQARVLRAVFSYCGCFTEMLTGVHVLLLVPLQGAEGTSCVPGSPALSSHT